MSMFDRHIDRLVCNFGDEWGSPEHKFRSSFSPVLKDDGSIDLIARADGRSKTFLNVSAQQWDRCIKKPVSASRQGSSYATRFFAFHWLEETNQLHLFFNTLKELQNA